jgi:hypothetical protein
MIGPEVVLGPDVYPTKTGGREWKLDDTSPCSDHLFSPGDPIKKYSGGGWEITGEVRMDVLTALTGSHSKQWRDVEITGKIYVISTFHSSYGSHFSFYARGGRHTDCGSNNECCDGSAYKGDLDVDKPGDTWGKKELWHVDYASNRGEHSTGVALIKRWVGWKVVIFNVNNHTVHMQGYIDKDADDNWVRAFNISDTGGWGASERSGCKNYLNDKQRTKDEVLAWSGPSVTYRSDGVTWAFKDLSVREVCALGGADKCDNDEFHGCANMKEGSSCADAKCHATFEDGRVEEYQGVAGA